MSVSLKIVVRFFLKYWEAIYKCGICLKGENGLNRITEITKLDILDLFQNGLEIDEFFQISTVKYNYYGRIEEIDFLERLYDLERMPSFDSRFLNAEQDISSIQ